MIYCIMGKQLGGKRWEDKGRPMQWGAGNGGKLLAVALGGTSCVYWVGCRLAKNN